MTNQPAASSLDGLRSLVEQVLANMDKTITFAGEIMLAPSTSADAAAIHGQWARKSNEWREQLRAALLASPGETTAAEKEETGDQSRMDTQADSTDSRTASSVAPDSKEWWRQVAQGLAVSYFDAERALDAAWTDIREWVRLAREQRAASPNPNHAPNMPSEAGIARSLAICDQIGRVKHPAASSVAPTATAGAGMDRMVERLHEIAAYAFSKHGNDAALYNSIKRCAEDLQSAVLSVGPAQAALSPPPQDDRAATSAELDEDDRE